MTEAIKDYSAGEVILDCDPLVHIISKNQKGIRCDYCFTLNNKLSVCSKCKSMYYCGKQCQKIDWRYHKDECKIYGKQYHNIADDYLMRLLLRLMLLIKRDSTVKTKKFLLHNGKYRCLEEMKSHIEEIKMDPWRTGEFERLCQVFNSCEVMFNDDEMLLLFGITIINSFSIFDITKYNGQIAVVDSGHGIYPSAAYYDHSCAPNASCVYSGSHLQIRSIKDIKIGDKIFNYYIFLDIPKSIRIEKLRKQYYFTCLCSRCTSDDNIIDYNRFKQLKTNLQFIIRSDKISLEETNDYPLIFDEMLSIAEQIYGNFHPDLVTLIMTIVLIKLNNPMVKCSLRYSDEQFLSKFGRIIVVVFGMEHNIYQIYTEIRIRILTSKLNIKCDTNNDVIVNEVGKHILQDAL